MSARSLLRHLATPLLPHAPISRALPNAAANPHRRFAATFPSLHMHPAVSEALSTTNITTPTAIQITAAPLILARQHTLIAAETGAGKTLAYLAPLLTLLKRDEAVASTHTTLTTAPALRPVSLVLLPTRELADQVLAVAKRLSHVVKFRARAAVGGPARGKAARALAQSPVDVLVATPGMVQKLREQNLLYFSRVSSIVIDEADVLLADSAGFHEQLRPIIHALTFKSSQNKQQQQEPDQQLQRQNTERTPVQFIYVAATLPNGLRNTLLSRHADTGLKTAKTLRLHKAAPPSELRTCFIRVAGGQDAKLQKAFELVKTALSRKGTQRDRILIFCNDASRRERLVELLRQRTAMRVVHMSSGGTDDGATRAADWADFAGDGDTRIAVCSRGYERGLDVTRVAMVVLVDVPFSGAEYLHRVGRVRGAGRAFVLVGHREEAMGEALFLAHVTGGNLAGITARSAWREYMSAGRDRIMMDSAVRKARRESDARWIDERDRAVGTFRGRRAAGAREGASGGSGRGRERGSSRDRSIGRSASLRVAASGRRWDRWEERKQQKQTGRYGR